MFQTEFVASNSVAKKTQRTDQVLVQLSNDLTEALESSKDPKRKLRHMALKTGVHIRTLRRLMKRENSPTHITVFKIYRYLLGEESQEKLLKLCPETIRNFLKNHCRIEKNLSYLNTAEHDLFSDGVLSEIYILCGAGPLSKTEIVKKFGEYGLKTVASMCAKKYLQETARGDVTIGPNPIYLSPEAVKTLGLIATRSFGKPAAGDTKGKHFMGFIAEGLNEAAYQEWLQIEREAHRKKLEISANPANLGSKKVFSFQIIDTLETK